jgi:hypothetical protein
MNWHKLGKEFKRQLPGMLRRLLIEAALIVSLLLLTYWLYHTGHILLGRVTGVITFLVTLWYAGPFIFL